MSLSDEQLLEEHFGHLPYFRKESSEWKSACPVCGGSENSDRFFMNVPDAMFDIVRGKCRGCGHFEPVFEGGKYNKFDEEAKRKWEAERGKREAKEKARIEGKIKHLNESMMATQFYESMSLAQRAAWRAQGIEDNSIERYRLGYVEQRVFGPKDDSFTTDALTIPFFLKAWMVANIQFRLLNPPEGVGKYRPLAGYPMELFLTLPDDPIEGTIYVVEGAKKAIVVAQRLWQTGAMSNVIAVPSKMPSRTLLDKFKDAERVFLVLDPDAYVSTQTQSGFVIEPAVKRIASTLLGNNPEQLVRLVELPVKPDDYFTQYGGEVDLFREFFKQAIRMENVRRTKYEPLFK